MNKEETPVKPLRADALRNYQRIITAANNEFLTRGADASLEGIARRAGVGIGTLYRHFPTRQKLAEAVFSGWLVDLTQKGEELAKSADPGDALWQWLTTLLELGIAYRGLKGTMLTNPEDQSELMMRQRAMLAVGAKLLLSAQRNNSVRQDVSIDDLLDLIHAVTVTSRPNAGASAQRLFSLMVEGLKKQA